MLWQLRSLPDLLVIGLNLYVVGMQALQRQY